MYLTRVFLDSASRLVRADLRSPESLHKTVMRAFPDHGGPSPRSAYAVLHRLDQESGGRLVLLVQSRTKPLPERWPDGYVATIGSDPGLAYSSIGPNPAIRSVAAEHAVIQVGRRFAFRLRANTTRKIDTKTGPDGLKRHGRRVPVRSNEERMAWLTRHADAAGFVVDERNVRATEIAAAVGRGHRSVTVAGALFEGILVVTDADRFRVALEAGIGPAKAYGFGLLSIARAQ